jgi:curved DNA-binding protein
MELKDYYKILGVSKDATQPEIKKAYRKLARKYHPDVSSEADAQEKFKEVNEANAILKDEKKRAEYDQMRQYGPQPGAHSHAGAQERHQGQPFSGGQQEFSEEELNAFFSSMFGEGGPRGHARQPEYKMRGQDFHYQLNISLEDSFQGASKTIQLAINKPGQSGHLETEIKTLNIKIPKGIQSGKHIRLKGQGEPGLNGGENGDLFIEIHMEPHKSFVLDGKNITTVVFISPWEAALGASIDVPTLKGKVSMKAPPNTRPGKKMRLKGLGLTSDGDQFVQFKIINPVLHSESDKRAFENLSKQFDFNPRTEGA